MSYWDTYDPDKRQLWEQQSWESDTWYDRFWHHYLPQRPPRTIKEAWRQWRIAANAPPGPRDAAPPAWYKAANAKDENGHSFHPDALGWKERASAFERYMKHIQLLELESRQKKVVERDFDQGERLRALGDDVLSAAPAFIKTTRRVVRGRRTQIRGEDGKLYYVQTEPDQVVITRELDWRAARDMIATGSELQRQAAGLSGRDVHLALTDGSGDELIPVDQIIAALQRARELSQPHTSSQSNLSDDESAAN